MLFGRWKIGGRSKELRSKVRQLSPPQQGGHTNSILNSNFLIWFLSLCSSSRPYDRASLRITALYFVVDVLSYSISDERSTVLKCAVETLDFGWGSIGRGEECLERLEGEDCGERGWCEEECREDGLFGRGHSLIQQVRREDRSKLWRRSLADLDVLKPYQVSNLAQFDQLLMPS